MIKQMSDTHSDEPLVINFINYIWGWHIDVYISKINKKLTTSVV